jgi:hypothetical protein
MAKVYQKCFGECYYADQWFPKQSNQDKLGFGETGVFQLDMTKGVIRNGLQKFFVHPGDWIVTDSLGRKTVVPDDDFKKHYVEVHASTKQAKEAL